MLFSGSVLVALLGAVLVAAEAQPHSLPDWMAAGPSSKSVYLTSDLSTSVVTRSTLVPTVTTTKARTTIKFGETNPVMPNQTLQPSYANSSLALTSTVTGRRDSMGVSRNITNTMSATRLPLASTAIANVTMVKPTGTGTPGNGTNRTTQATPPPKATSLGSTITPYGAGLVALLVGSITMGF